MLNQPSHPVSSRKPKVRTRFYWPREHGGWSMLATACLVGAAATSWSVGAVAATVVAFCLFMVREPLYAIVNGRNAWRQFAATLVTMLVPGTYLLWHTAFMWVAAAAIFAMGSTYGYLRLRQLRRERSTVAETVGILQLTSAVPLVYVFGGGLLEKKPLLLWLLVCVYYTGSIFYVQMRVQQAKEKSPKAPRNMKLGWANLGYQAGVFALLGILTATAVLPLWLWLGLLPNILKSLIHTFVPAKTLQLKRLGIQEMIFAAAATAALVAWAAV